MFVKKPQTGGTDSKSRDARKVGVARAVDQARLSLPSTTSSNFSPESKSLQAPITQHRRLELDIPLDWSPSGLLNYARAAQQHLIQASEPFGHTAQAELEWNSLSPALRDYIHARQHLDLALMLQLNSVFTTTEVSSSFLPPDQSMRPTTDIIGTQSKCLEPQPGDRSQGPTTHSGISNRRQLNQTKITKSSIKSQTSQIRVRQSNEVTQARTQPEVASEVSKSHSRGTSSSDSVSDEPERIQWLKELATFQKERRQWTHERKRLETSIHELEENQSQSYLRITSVTHDFERLKKKLLEVDQSTRLESETKIAVATDQAQNFKARETTIIREPTSSSSSKRVSPPKYTAQEEANLERLASSLMANLVRLDGHQVRPHDIPLITGERGAWKAVIEHLLTLGKIQRQGEFIAISMVERLRRGLQTVKIGATNNKKTT